MSKDIYHRVLSEEEVEEAHRHSAWQQKYMADKIAGDEKRIVSIVWGIAYSNKMPSGEWSRVYLDTATSGFQQLQFELLMQLATNGARELMRKDGGRMRFLENYRWPVRWLYRLLLWMA